MQAASAWRAEPPLAPPAVLSALSARSRVSGFDVGVTAFTSPSVGWAVVGGLTDCWLLRTDDAGQTWTPRLASATQIRTMLAFGAREAGLVIGVAPARDKVNGHGVGTGDYGCVMVGTEDTGRTWTVGTPPHPKELTGVCHMLSARRLWAVAVPFGRAHRDVVRTPAGCWRDGAVLPLHLLLGYLAPGLAILANDVAEGLEGLRPHPGPRPPVHGSVNGDPDPHGTTGGRVRPARAA